MTEAKLYLELIHQDSFLQTMLISYEHAAKYAGHASVLDFGCGYGWGSYLLSSRSRHVTGYDPDFQRIDFARQIFQRNNITFLSNDRCLADSVYDMVCLFMVLPYAKNKLQLLNQAASYLHPDGTLWISFKTSTPELSILLNRWRIACGFSQIHSEQRCLSKTESVSEHIFRQTGMGDKSCFMNDAY